MNEQHLFIAAAIAGIISAVIAFFTLIFTIWREVIMPINILRLILTIVGGMVFLGVFGIVIYWAAIIFATGSGGTPVDLVLRSTTYATIFGIILGTLWGLLLPRLTRFVRIDGGNNRVV